MNLIINNNKTNDDDIMFAYKYALKLYLFIDFFIYNNRTINNLIYFAEMLCIA